ncbi:hypothetical protein RNZ50_16385 [Paracoccaceae bacterium Fryx2]|nr:hypothetical protein [Paracoccaceae bacterium Fryx2]
MAAKKPETIRDETDEYFIPAAAVLRKTIREVTPLDQMYGYYTAD